MRQRDLESGRDRHHRAVEPIDQARDAAATRARRVLTAHNAIGSHAGEPIEDALARAGKIVAAVSVGADVAKAPKMIWHAGTSSYIIPASGVVDAWTSARARLRDDPHADIDHLIALPPA
jgi:hypothetical protein